MDITTPANASARKLTVDILTAIGYTWDFICYKNESYIFTAVRPIKEDIMFYVCAVAAPTKNGYWEAYTYFPETGRSSPHSRTKQEAIDLYLLNINGGYVPGVKGQFKDIEVRWFNPETDFNHCDTGFIEDGVFVTFSHYEDGQAMVWPAKEGPLELIKVDPHTIRPCKLYKQWSGIGAKTLLKGDR